MGDISARFNRSEFECQCGCGFDTVDIELIHALELVRVQFDAPVTITSGCRCETHNSSIGGSDDSQHKYGRAADFKVKGVTPKEVYEFLDRRFSTSFGIGLYSSWVHLDSRNERVRW